MTAVRTTRNSADVPSGPRKTKRLSNTGAFLEEAWLSRKLATRYVLVERPVCQGSDRASYVNYAESKLE